MQLVLGNEPLLPAELDQMVLRHQVACIENQQIEIKLLSSDEGIMSVEDFKVNRNLTLYSFN